MRISLLLEREPFAKILEQTLARYWSEQSGRLVTVEWHQGKPATAKQAAQSQRWYVNSYLNAIFTAEADSAVFEPIQREFARSPLWWKRPLQRAYVALATRPQSAARLAQATVTVTPAIAEANQMLVVGGNHKLRILHRQQNQVICLLKAGFEPCFWERELETRQQAATHGLPVPTLLAVDKDRRWFVEAYVSGTPINRLAQASAANQAVRAIATRLQPLLAETQGEVDRCAYANQLQQRIKLATERNHLLAPLQKQAVNNLAAKLVAAVEQTAAHGTNLLVTALTHGDFQPANILVNTEGVWLIDWEYADRRQSGYDALVFALASRVPEGLAQRMQRFVHEGWPTASPLYNFTWLGMQDNSEYKRRSHLLLFLLEEVLLHLEENQQPTFTRVGSGLLSIQNEIVKALATLA